MPQFATAVELSTYLTGNTTPTAEFTAQANLLLTLISADIQAAAGNVITPTEESTHLLPGVWGRDLELPQRPVISVSAVSVNGTPIAAATYAWNSRQILRRGADGWGFDDNPFEDWNERGMGGAGWQSGQHWGGPASTIAVTYEFGRAETPDAIRSLALRVAGRVIENPTSVSSEQLAVYSVTYGKEAIGGATHLNPHEIRMLRKRYGRTGGTFHPRGRG